jgi:hypothetical protein
MNKKMYVSSYFFICLNDTKSFNARGWSYFDDFPRITCYLGCTSVCLPLSLFLSTLPLALNNSLP